jgi:osmotically-inducible protein OsmY
MTDATQPACCRHTKVRAAWEDHFTAKRCNNPKDFTMTRSINRIAASALFALAAGAFLPAHAATNDADLASHVQSTLSSQLGSDAKDLTVTASNGTVTLHGWAQGPQEESKARYVASTVPGVVNAYSDVRTFSNGSND